MNLTQSYVAHFIPFYFSPQIDIDPITQIARAKEEGKVVLVDYTAAWCGPCKMIAPILDKMADAADSSRIEFYKVDVDEAGEISHRAGIKAVCSFECLRYHFVHADNTYSNHQMPTFRAYHSKQSTPGEDYAEIKGAVPVKLEVRIYFEVTHVLIHDFIATHPRITRWKQLIDTRVRFGRHEVCDMSVLYNTARTCIIPCTHFRRYRAEQNRNL